MLLLYPCCKFEINLRLLAIYLYGWWQWNILLQIKSQNFTFGLPCYLRRENSVIPHSFLMQLDACLILTRRLKLIWVYLLPGWRQFSSYIWQNSSFYGWCIFYVSLYQPDSKQTPIYFKLATWTMWASSYIIMLWGRSGSSSLRSHSSPNV